MVRQMRLGIGLEPPHLSGQTLRYASATYQSLHCRFMPVFAWVVGINRFPSVSNYPTLPHIQCLRGAHLRNLGLFMMTAVSLALNANLPSCKA